LGRIERLDTSVGAVLTLLPERALAHASESTRRWATGEQRPLEGIPYGLKDIIAAEGIRTTGGSLLYADYLPEESAAVQERLEAAGGVLVAKLQTFEFAAGANAITCNPWALDRSAAGSSSGSAAAVAARELPLALGTDTTGSIAIPAAFTGITGLKPTYGRVPRHGVMPISWTLDHVGPMTRSAVDAALALNVLAGHDPRDPTSSPSSVQNYLLDIDFGVGGLRIGKPIDWFFDVCDPQVAEATHESYSTLSAAGAIVAEVSLPTTRRVDIHAIDTTIVAAELASLHRINFDRLDDYGPEFSRLLARAQFVHASDYLQALRVRHLIQLDFERAFDEVDVLIVPGCVSVAPRHDDLRVRIGREEVPWVDVVSRTTKVFDIAGLPSCTIPSGFDDLGLPMSISIVARPFAESLCLRVARAYQSLTPHHAALPPLVAIDSAQEHAAVIASDLPPIVERPVTTATSGPPTW
jgi:aspartyl-tRNA(Asn)/glutamyl-tRNA(Gln) amidotransferase subunit A